MHAVLDSVRIRTPLGLRFWDATLDRPVQDQLIVQARPFGTADKPQLARPTPSGYAFHNLRGLHNYEYPPETSSTEPVEPRNFLIEIRDLGGRFMPVALKVEVPPASGPLYPPAEAGSPLTGVSAFYLFSAPTRRVPAEVTVIRAELWDELIGEPARYALLEVVIAGEEWFGLSDDRGQAAIFLPYPPASLVPGSSPSHSLAPGEQSWPVLARVRYQPAAQVWVRGATVPELRSIRDQMPAQILLDSSSPPVTSSPVPTEVSALLRFGEELVLRSGSSPRLHLLT